MAGLTSSGFERKTLAQILDSLDERARLQFGANFNTNDDSVYRQITGPISLELDNLWQATEEAYSAYTRTGAEGVHLDNYFNILGVQRLDAQASSGPLLIETDDRFEGTSFTLTSRRFTRDGSNLRYLNTQTTLGQTNTHGYTLSTSQLVSGQVYTARVIDDAGDLQTLPSTPLNNESDKLSYLGALRTFILGHIAASADKVHVVSSTLYIGFNADTSFNILTDAIDFNISPLAGNRYGRVNITATETGRNPVTPLTEFRITPNFTGFVRAVTFEDFNPGRNVETDAELRIRGSNSLRSEAIGTLDALFQQLSLLSGVNAVRIYENTTNRPTTEVPSSWSYHVVISGGVDSEIAQVLHTYGPLNVNQHGSTIVNVINRSGGTSPQRFSNATVRDIDIRISYTTSDGTELTQAEQDLIVANMIALRGNLDIAGDIPNLLLQRPVLCSLPFDRLDSLTIETKAEGADDSTYTTAELDAGVFDIFNWDADNIIFRRV